jgi:hypothetical protein
MPDHNLQPQGMYIHLRPKIGCKSCGIPHFLTRPYQLLALDENALFSLLSSAGMNNMKDS